MADAWPYHPRTIGGVARGGWLAMPKTAAEEKTAGFTGKKEISTV